MIFKPELAAKVLAGTKTMTRRRIHGSDAGIGWAGATRYRLGQTYAVQTGRGKPHVGHILITQISVEPLRLIAVGDAQREGFLNVGEFLYYWERLHGTPKLDESVLVIGFEFAGRCQRCAQWPV